MFRRSLVVVVFCVPLRAADLDKFAPADAGAAIVLNVKSLADAALFKKYVETPFKDGLAKDEQLAKFCKAAEFDPLTDLTSITITAPLIFNVRDAKASVLLKGKFHARFQVAVLAAAKTQGDAVKITTRGERTYFTVRMLAGPSIVATFVGFDTIVLASSVDHLDDLLAGKSPAPTADAAILHNAFALLDDRLTFRAAFAVGGDLKKWMADLPALKLCAESMEFLRASIHVTDGFDLTIIANMVDADSAKALGQLIKQALPLLNLLAAQNEQMKPAVAVLLKHLKVAAEGKLVSVQLSLTAALVEDALGARSPDQVARARESARAALDAGTAALRAERYADAERAFTELHRLDPENEGARAALQQALKSSRAAERAWVAAWFVRRHLDAGAAALLIERFVDAEREVNAARELDPANAEAVALLRSVQARRVAIHLAAGRAALERERFADAEWEFTEARKFDPANKEVGGALERLPAARKAALTARLDAGRAALAARKWADATLSIGAALRLEPQCQEAADLRRRLHAARAAEHLEAAAVALQANRFTAAESEFAQALQFAPGNPTATRGLVTTRARRCAALLADGRAALEAGKVGEVERTLAAVAALAALNSDAAELRKQLLPRAVAHYLEAGRAALRADRPDEAVHAFRAVLGYEPGNTEAAEGLTVASARQRELRVASLRRDLLVANPGLRLQAAEALGELGPAAKAAIPTLRAVLAADDSPFVRAAARAALKKIEP